MTCVTADDAMMMMMMIEKTMMMMMQMSMLSILTMASTPRKLLSIMKNIPMIMRNPRRAMVKRQE